MSYIGQGLPADTFQGFTTDSFTGDGSATTFTLSKEPFSEDTLIVVINNVIQKPTTNFTVSGTTLTIVGTAVASGDVIYAIHMGGPLPIGGASELDLNGASDKLILDLDGDTTISADTDDQIDFKAGGTDVMSMTATGLTINDGTTVTTADNTDTLTLTSTDADANSGPNLRLYRNSGSPAVGDNLGQIDFEGRNDNSQDVVYASMMARARDETDGTEDGGFQIDIMQGGTLRSLMKYYSDGAAQEVSFNDDSIDVDFRVESNGNANMIFVDGGNDVVGIGTSEPNSYNDYANNLVVLENGNAGITIVAGTSNNSSLYFADGTSGNAQYRGWVDYLHASDSLRLATGGDARLTIDSSGLVGIGTTSPSPFRLLVDSNSSNNGVAKFNHSNATPEGIRIIFSAAAPDNTSATFLECTDSSDTRLQIQAQGNVQNHDNSYGQISDERIKDNIVDANSQWDDIKALKVRNFERKDDIAKYGEGKKVQIGLIAQECETVSPGLVNEQDPSPGDIRVASEFGTLYTADDSETQDAVLYTSDDQEVIDGNKNVGDIKTPATKQIGDVKEVKEQVKAISYSVLYMKAIKALQEAMAKIETLETKVKALEDA